MYTTTLNDRKATHVRIISAKNTPSNFVVTEGEIYPVIRNMQRGFEGEEIIVDDAGNHIHCFSLCMKCEWLNKI